jgi:hypothetical protein
MLEHENVEFRSQIEAIQPERAPPPNTLGTSEL